MDKLVCTNTKGAANTPHLLALNASTNVEPMDQFLQDGSKRCHTNTTTHQDGNVVSRPVLVALSIRPVQEELWPRLPTEHRWVDAFPEVEGPWPNNADVEGEVLLVWC